MSPSSLDLYAKLLYIRKYVKGFDAKDGYTANRMKLHQRLLDRYGPPDENIYLSDQAREEIENVLDMYRIVRTAESKPHEWVQNQYWRQSNQKINRAINQHFGFGRTPNAIFKGHFVPATERDIDIALDDRTGAVFSTDVYGGRVRKYYIEFDHFQAIGPDGQLYIEELIDESIPAHLDGRGYRVMGSMRYEFGPLHRTIRDLLYSPGSGPNRGIVGIANKYRNQDSDLWLTQIVVYAWDTYNEDREIAESAAWLFDEDIRINRERRDKERKRLKRSLHYYQR